MLPMNGRRQRARMGFRATAFGALITWLALHAFGCASIPPHQHGVAKLEVVGMHALSEAQLKACLAIQARKKVSLGLSALRDPACGEPPFDAAALSVDLFAWPWTEWPIYDDSVLKLDVERVERWYRARGYYGAHVVKVQIDPPGARDALPCEGDDCAVSLRLHVEEGKPITLRRVTLQDAQPRPAALQAELRAVLTRLEVGRPLDEAVYTEVKQALGRVMGEAGYARAVVRGRIDVHRGLGWADVTLRIDPGPVCKIGTVRITSTTPVPTGPVRAASQLQRGQIYREGELEDAQRSIYALGSFSAVTVHGKLEGRGEFVDVEIELEPRRASEILLGAGMMSGVLPSGPTAEEWVSVPQWDAHLIARYEHRNFFGGLRRLHVEERPRLLFLGAFPSVPSNSPRFGNSIETSFAQPGVIEARTSLVTEARWDYGPDPFQRFHRHDMGAAVGLERDFFRQRLSVRVAVHQDILEVTARQPIIDASLAPSSYRLPFLEQRVALDLRDDAVNPTRGAYFRLSAHGAARLWDPSWNYLRLTQEARGYVPAGLGVVLAARFAVGSLHVLDASHELDAQSQKLGPQTYRLRGGGAQSNRGFPSGELGDGILGGIRRWESSLELRIPLTRNFSVATFTDAGDVHAAPSFRFSHLNTAVGGGLRYRTLIGPLRLDVGVRPDRLQRVHGDAPSGRSTTDLGFVNFKGAIHLTIGESF